MLKSAATLDDRGELALAAQPERTKPGPAVMRFAYATGSRPLDGYTIKRGVGRGGFGEVYFAISDAGKEVAAQADPPQSGCRAPRRHAVPEPQAPEPVALYDIKLRRRRATPGSSWSTSPASA